MLTACHGCLVNFGAFVLIAMSDVRKQFVTNLMMTQALL